MKKIYKILFIYLFIFQANAFKGQNSLMLKKIDQQNGLSNSRITGIIKEKNGFIWISTQNGLNRYDGHSFKVYQKRNSKISSNDISDIILDSKNRIWLSTLDGSLNLYNKDVDDFTVYNNYSKKSNSSSSNHINKILEDKNGTIWLATELGLINFNPENKTFKNYEDSILKNINITSLYQSDNGNLWIGSFGKGLFLIDRYTQEIKKIDLQNDHLIQFINVFEELNSDNLLIGTKGNGLSLFDLQTKKLKSYFKQNNSLIKKNTSIIRSLKIDSNSNLWIGTDGFGLYKIKFPNSDEPIIENYMYNPQLQSSLSGNAVYEITEIDKSSIWIGTAWNGINIIDLENTNEFLHSDFSGLNPFPVLSIHKTNDLLFFGTDGNGLSVYDLKNKKPYSIPKIQETKYVQHISSNNNNLWLGTFSNGLINYNLKTKQYKQFVKSIENEKSLSFNDVRDLIFDKSNNIWIATWGGGLNYFDTKNEEFLSYQFKENDATSLSNNNIVSLEKDDNKIWIATYGGGLNMFDTNSKSFKRFNFSENNSETISSNFLFSLYKDSNNYLWIGTSGSGVCRMNLNDFSIERFNSYKYSTITSIKEDLNKNIWFGTKKGILKFDFKTSKIERAQTLSGDFHINSSFKDNNNLYFGGIKGVTKFNPNQLYFSNKKVDVIITDFKLFNKKVSITKNGILKKNIQVQKDITLKHSDNVFTFEYAGLNYPFSENLEYAIQLENFDKDWRKVGQDRTVTFTNLSPGNYVFKVKSKILGTAWNDNFTAINIKILKPFWTTWWAIAMYLLFLLTLLLIARKYVIAWGKLKSSLEFEKLMHNKDNEIYTLKQQFFTNISHEIRTPVTLIISSINRLFENEKLKESKQIKAAHTIRRNSNLLLRLVNELLDVRKLEKNDIQLTITENEFISYVKGIYLSFSDVALDRNINYEFKTDISKIYLWFDKNQLEKVIFNLISNAFKFTNDRGNIQIYIEEHHNEVVVLVKDDGIGLSIEHQKKIFKRFYQVKYEHSEKNKGFGLGLSIAKEIVQLHKATILVSSKLKEGSTFELKLLKGNTHFKENLALNSENSEEKNTIEQLEKKISDRKNKRETILIVEDHEEIQESLKELLENENYAIIQAFNGVQGLRLASTSLPDLIISDVMMPEMDGIELSKKIKLNSITSHIPIIILTAKTSTKDTMDGFETGADEYIIKPYNEKFLINRIKNLLKNRKILKEKFINNNLLNPKELTINSQDQIFLENLYKLLEENLQSNNLKAQIISKKLNMSHSSMYKKIKTLTGLTYMEFIRDYRLSIAKQLIQEMGYSVSEACYKVGYSDSKHFSKLFKNKFKQNPSSYLKS